MALATGIDPWSLLNIPDEVRDALEVVWIEQQTAQERAQRRGDLRAKLKAATGR